MCVFLCTQGQNLYHILEVNDAALDFSKQCNVKERLKCKKCES